MHKEISLLLHLVQVREPKCPKSESRFVPNHDQRPDLTTSFVPQPNAFVICHIRNRNAVPDKFFRASDSIPISQRLSSKRHLRIDPRRLDTGHGLK